MHDSVFRAAVRAIDIDTLLSCAGDIRISLASASEKTVAATAYQALNDASRNVDQLRFYLLGLGCSMSEQEIDKLVFKYSTSPDAEGLWQLDASGQLVWNDVLSAC